MTKPKLLLHTCCAPCVTVPLERLGNDYDVTCFFYNPNIHPKKEYQQRRDELLRLAKELNFRVVVHNYDVDHWFQLVAGLENEPEGGRRCELCFKMRLVETAKFARENGFDIFTTTLTISPHKNAALINQIGAAIGVQYQVTFLAENFKKRDGYKRSVELSKKYHLYRQTYCGCLYSRRKNK